MLIAYTLKDHISCTLNRREPVKDIWTSNRLFELLIINIIIQLNYSERPKFETSWRFVWNAYQCHLLFHFRSLIWNLFIANFLQVAVKNSGF